MGERDNALVTVTRHFREMRSRMHICRSLGPKVNQYVGKHLSFSWYKIMDRFLCQYTTGI